MDVAHPRKLIRQAVVALLTGATAAGTRVHGTRVDPYRGSRIPAISVYTLNDPVNEDVSTDTEDTHELELEIAGFVSHSEAVPVDDAMAISPRKSRRPCSTIATSAGWRAIPG